MARNDAQLKLRLSAELKGYVEAAATQNKRSINSEIVSRLHASFDSEKNLTSSVTDLNELMMSIVMMRSMEAKGHIKLDSDTYLDRKFAQHLLLQNFKRLLPYIESTSFLKNDWYDRIIDYINAIEKDNIEDLRKISDSSEKRKDKKDFP